MELTTHDQKKFKKLRNLLGVCRGICVKKINKIDNTQYLTPKGKEEAEFARQAYQEMLQLMDSLLGRIV